MHRLIDDLEGHTRRRYFDHADVPTSRLKPLGMSPHTSSTSYTVGSSEVTRFMKPRLETLATSTPHYLKTANRMLITSWPYCRNTFVKHLVVGHTGSKVAQLACHSQLQPSLRDALLKRQDIYTDRERFQNERPGLFPYRPGACRMQFYF